MTGLLSLPPELRDEIYTYIVDTPTDNIAAFEGQQELAQSRHLRNVAAQPAISRVNKEIRAEVLPLFYKRNDFLVELSQPADLELAKRWLQAIGDADVRSLRWLTLCGWGFVNLGSCRRARRIRCNFWVKVRFDLMQGQLEFDDESEVSDGEEGGGGRRLRKDIRQLREFYQRMVEERRREGRGFTREGLSGLMDIFQAFL
ncbi:hypothetical protein BDY17DRAFT_190189 [Neohortaea acidophila]|uniref:F-box domain-containing protein n=1 Tax=Neohortaea acidophila TaxID=245834 RepID=A0A6A6PQN1_9PEZI|nr:uncharacterized protein BDY17DRAFT_190189 [Neohortaea acidophila]KAF2481547.1 hypothetical protein BDY17DRAFT_190189 [Neohortaea acidophila]